MSIASIFDRLDSPRMVTATAPGFPPQVHPAEADMFSRQSAMPGHDQARLEAAHVVVVGCGGLGSWISVGLARMGVRRLTIIDPDSFDRTNAPRQLLFPHDLGKPKAHALAKNLISHMTNGGEVLGIADGVEETLNELDETASALVVGVDNNRARLDAARFCLERRLPVVFAMLSRDGLRAQVFLQRPAGPCLSCVLPNLDADSAAPCAAAAISSCFLAAAHTVQLVVGALCQSPVLPIWRETSLDGSTERALQPARRVSCAACGNLT